MLTEMKRKSLAAVAETNEFFPKIPTQARNQRNYHRKIEKMALTITSSFFGWILCFLKKKVFSPFLCRPLNKIERTKTNCLKSRSNNRCVCNMLRSFHGVASRVVSRLIVEGMRRWESAYVTAKLKRNHTTCEEVKHFVALFLPQLYQFV